MVRPKEILASKVERLQRDLTECAQDSEELFQAAHSAYLKSQEKMVQCEKLLER
jgi:hypothetical protein